MDKLANPDLKTLTEFFFLAESINQIKAMVRFAKLTEDKKNYSNKGLFRRSVCLRL